jgi:hypothetical protein
MTDLLRDNPYYDKQIFVQITNGIDEVCVRYLTIRIIPGTRQSLPAGQLEKLIHFEVIIIHR